jgi:hypothetical protein
MPYQWGPSQNVVMPALAASVMTAASTMGVQQINEMTILQNQRLQGSGSRCKLPPPPPPKMLSLMLACCYISISAEVEEEADI